MKKVVFLLIVVSLSLISVQAQRRHVKHPVAQTQVATTQIMPLDEVRPGMKGVAYTVFQGTKPEPMGLEVLGVLRNLNGPRSNMILVRLIGDKPEYTRAVAGMSGSPAYINEKLVGELGVKIGSV